MDELQAIQQRHSVRRFKSQPISDEHASELFKIIDGINEESGLDVQLVRNESKAFSGMMAKYGGFRGVTDYVAMVGKDDKLLGERCGYYGERLVLQAQMMGLNTCWVALTYKKTTAVRVEKGNKLAIVIAIGYGEDDGKPHKSKTAEQVSNLQPCDLEWFKKGVECALLAPTAINQQAFTLTRDANEVEIKYHSPICREIDLGIVKYHFELGAGKDNFSWR